MESQISVADSGSRAHTSEISRQAILFTVSFIFGVMLRLYM